jgi:hypothetical protein
MEMLADWLPALPVTVAVTVAIAAPVLVGNANCRILHPFPCARRRITVLEANENSTSSRRSYP